MGDIFGYDFCKVYAENTTMNIAHDLKVLGLDYVDLMLVHWPCTTVDESVATYKAVEKMIEDKTARAIGVSNFNSTIFPEFLSKVSIKPAVNQCQMSIGDHDDDTIKFCKVNNITYQAYSPLGGLSHVDVLHDPDVKKIAENYSVSPAQVALRWVAQYGCIFVTAATKKDYLVEDLDIFSFELTDDEMDLLASK